jgi:hypothetical protein
MSSKEDADIIARRRLLKGATGAAALLGMGHASAAPFQGPVSTGFVPPSAVAHLATLRNYKSQRSSSYDRSGGNADSVKVNPGATVSLLDVNGPGMVTHLWVTISSKDTYHLKNLVLRAYWDGESEPSVEAPIGDFFGLMLGEYFLYQSALTTVSSIKAMNAYFPMPFARSARITVTNDGKLPADSFYFNFDYITSPNMPPDMGYFHAQYRQAAPCEAWTKDWQNEYASPVGDKKNLTGEGNYVFFEATGRGHFVGVTHGVVQNQEGWWGEGDEMIFIDGEDHPAINGTGTEDYYNGAWNFGGITAAQPFSYLHNGAPYIVDAERIGGRYCLYRWHLEDPITFEKSIKVGIEHGHANHRSDSFFSTAYWYQTEPHARFSPLPAAADRIPRVIAIDSPAGAKRS